MAGEIANDLNSFRLRWLAKYLLRDRDAIDGRQFQRRVKSMGIGEVLTAPRSSSQSAFVERVMGSIRRDCLDHVIVWNELHLSLRIQLEAWNQNVMTGTVNGKICGTSTLIPEYFYRLNENNQTMQTNNLLLSPITMGMYDKL